MVKTFVFFVSIDLGCFFNARDSRSNPFLISGIGIEAHTVDSSEQKLFFALQSQNMFAKIIPGGSWK